MAAGLFVCLPAVEASLGLVDEACAQVVVPPTNPDIDDLADVFLNIANTFQPTLITLGRQLFWVLFGIQLLIIGLNLVIRGPASLSSSSALGFENPLANLLVFFIVGALAWVVVYTAGPWAVGGASGGGWVRAIYDVFEGIGREINACPPAPAPCVEPGTVFGAGESLSLTILAKAGNMGWGIFAGLTWILVSFFCAFVVILCYIGIAVQLALTETVFVLTITTAPIFIATTIFRPTSGLASGYIAFIAYLGIKMLFLYLLAGIALNMGDGWSTDVNAIPGGAMAQFQLFMFQLMGATAFLAILTVYLPGRVANAISSRLDLDLHALLRPEA